MRTENIEYFLKTVQTGSINKASELLHLNHQNLGKIIMSLGWASLYTFLNVIFRKYFGISIVSSFFFGTGILIIGAAAILGNNSLLNIFLYGSSVYACLSSSALTVVVCLVVSVVWAVIYNVLGTVILSKSDVY